MGWLGRVLVYLCVCGLARLCVRRLVVVKSTVCIGAVFPDLHTHCRFDHHQNKNMNAVGTDHVDGFICAAKLVAACVQLLWQPEEAKKQQ